MTKKILAPFSFVRNSPVGKSFVVPIHDGSKPIFVSLGTLKPVEFGIMLYLGREISAEDIFAKIVQNGIKILPSVEIQMSLIIDYISQLPPIKVGDVVKMSIHPNGGILLGDKIDIRGEKISRKLP